MSISYNPNKRWSFTLKETFQHNDFLKVSEVGRTKFRYNDDNEMYSYEDPTTKNHKEHSLLRTKLTAAYDIKGFPVDIFASVDYGRSLNYNAEKWKFTAGYDYKINKKNKVSLFYRYTTENIFDEEGADDPNGHLVGLGYKFDF